MEPVGVSRGTTRLVCCVVFWLGDLEICIARPAIVDEMIDYDLWKFGEHLTDRCWVLGGKWQPVLVRGGQREYIFQEMDARKSLLFLRKFQVAKRRVIAKVNNSSGVDHSGSRSWYGRLAYD